MTSCQYCGQAVEPGSFFCWGCGKNDPIPGAKKSKGSSNKAGKIVLIVVGALVGLALTFTAVSFAIGQLQNGPTNIIQDPSPTPTDGGFSKQDGN
jgi:hypothetical protein